AVVYGALVGGTGAFVLLGDLPLLAGAHEELGAGDLARGLSTIVQVLQLRSDPAVLTGTDSIELQPVEFGRRNVGHPHRPHALLALHTPGQGLARSNACQNP